jgi:pyruvate dehydrogenase E1 component beta subunit
MPSSAYDAKGLMAAAIQENNPVVFIDDRWLYGTKTHVPNELYTVPLGKGKVVREGKDATVVAVSYMVKETIEAAEILADEGIDIEIIDPRTIKPLDTEIILNSINKTGRLVVADGGWKSYGVAAEITAVAAENCVSDLKANIERVCLPDIPAPASRTLEAGYYPKCAEIVEAVKKTIR